MKKKFVIVGLIMVMCLGILGGCSNKYNAEVINDAKSLMNENFLETNMTLGSDLKGDTTLPPKRTHIIKDHDSFDLVFNDFPKEVDFSEKMILIHFCTSSYPLGPYKIERISLDGDVLSVDYKLDKGLSVSPDAGRPQQTCIVVVMDNLDVKEVLFNQR